MPKDYIISAGASTEDFTRIKTFVDALPERILDYVMSASNTLCGIEVHCGVDGRASSNICVPAGAQSMMITGTDDKPTYRYSYGPKKNYVFVVDLAHGRSIEFVPIDDKLENE